MNIEYTFDKLSRMGYVYLRAGEVAYSKELDGIILDYDKDNNVVGAELLDVSSMGMVETMAQGLGLLFCVDSDISTE